MQHTLMESIHFMKKGENMSRQQFDSDSLVLTNETFDFQKANEDIVVEDHFDECDFIRD